MSISPFQSTETCEQLKQRWFDHFRYRSDSNAPVYTIIMPPPNVTGSLHVGHALSSTQQDILIRFHKALGKNVLWLPGTDHAGIATQMMVEKELEKEGLTRKQLGRTAFLERMWRWKETHETRILQQIKRMGFVADWSHLTFTLDEKVSHATREAFIRLYNQEKIYKAKRLVNWDSVLGTALSDLEVDNIQEEGSMWALSYEVEGGGTVHVATTRPETILGDTAVAVHPQDERYAVYVGRRAKVPLVDRWVPIIADDRIDPEKGTGVVKITPAHDFLDCAIGQTHGLSFIDIFDEKGQLNHHVPSAFQGMSKQLARDTILEQLGERVISQTRILHNVPHSQRSGCVIEPRLTEQWFLDTTDMAKEGLDVVQEGLCQFFPKEWEKTYSEWLTNIQPWCISRQLWWGHQIPAWYDEKGRVFVAHTEEEARQLANNTGSTGPLTQDEDVLDTWFSSGLWPFSTLGWPDEEHPLFKACYPTSVLVTGFDIIFFWVARMVMLGTTLTGRVPFRHVCIHPLVCDAKGKKMSKTKGNVIDPMTLADTYGVDALRFSLALASTPSAYTSFGEKQVELSRNFLTKVTNLVRFSELNQIQGCEHIPEHLHHDMNIWIVQKISTLISTIHKALSSYSFHEAASSIYSTVWGSVCDWYVEWAKDTLKICTEDHETRQVLGWVLNTVLKILHPFAPFAAQALWEKANPTDVKGVFEYPWPEVLVQEPYDDKHTSVVSIIDTLQEIIIIIRRIRCEFKLASSQTIQIHAYAPSKALDQLAPHVAFIERLTRIECTLHADKTPDQGSGLFVHLGEITLVFAIQHLLDMGKEIARLEQQHSKFSQQLAQWQERLSQDAFRKHADAQVIQDLEIRCTSHRATLSRIEVDLEMLRQVIIS